LALTPQTLWVIASCAAAFGAAALDVHNLRPLMPITHDLTLQFAHQEVAVRAHQSQPAVVSVVYVICLGHDAHRGSCGVDGKLLVSGL
jgi:hypothetical protein